MTRHRQNPQRRPRRLTPAEADRLVSDLSPAERAAQLADILAMLRANGVDAKEIRDAGGRTFLDINMTAMRERLPRLADLYEALAEITPLPSGPKGVA